jgi:hypothetical protein
MRLCTKSGYRLLFSAFYVALRTLRVSLSLCVNRTCTNHLTQRTKRPAEFAEKTKQARNDFLCKAGLCEQTYGLIPKTTSLGCFTSRLSAQCQTHTQPARPLTPTISFRPG